MTGASTSTFRPSKRPRNLTEEETAAITRNFTRGDFYVGNSAPVRSVIHTFSLLYFTRHLESIPGYQSGLCSVKVTLCTLLSVKLVPWSDCFLSLIYASVLYNPILLSVVVVSKHNLQVFYALWFSFAFASECFFH